MILDTRDYKEPVETLTTKLKDILKSLGADVTKAENLGRHDFIRVTDRRHVGDLYVQIEFAGPANVPADLQERVRLDKTVKRVMVQSL
ncbi:MAG: 30S ribosomal protein S6 [Verrucomicrobiota bacterium JB022]|nr:30S ribosomal protein S6 [Verrucomicrobiota bacterium JB022]